MLELRNIKKDYITQDLKVEALKGISVSLRDHEFVSILGPSGCGKTTTLNIIGGLDRYTDGDLLIDGVSTKEYNDKDWDIYRNHKVGFVFQSYNLIPHQTVLSNVILSLTIGNVKKELKKALAIEALEKVGLKGEINKYPRQLSGGQMQRVAIARAIVNKPKILLADEPTGALDSKTSIQVMDILKELSNDCLVLMVTHNEELANTYSTRIISLKDGELTSDTNPYEIMDKERDDRIKEVSTLKDSYINSNTNIYNNIENNKKKPKKNKDKRKVGMPFVTALRLSLSNLKSKLGRTLLTCIAGSIGIIGIALILSVSNGFHNYIYKTEESTLSQYPLTITKSNLDMTSLFMSLMAESESKETNAKENMVTPNYVMVELLHTLASAASYNDLKPLKAYIEENYSKIEKYVADVKYEYNVALNFYTYKPLSDGSMKYQVLNPFTLPKYYDEEKTQKVYVYDEAYDATFMEGFMSNLSIWDEMYSDLNIVKSQYNLLAGSWPTEANEVLYVVDENNQISDFAAYCTGLVPNGEEYIRQLFKYVNNPKVEEDPANIWDYEFTFDDLLNNVIYCVPNSSYYKADPTDILKDYTTFSMIDRNNDSEMIDLITNSPNKTIKLKVAGIITENPNSDTHSIDGTIAYSKDLTKLIYDMNNDSDICKAQREFEDYCLVNMIDGFPTKGMKWDDIKNALIALNNDPTSDVKFPQATIDMINKEMMLDSMMTSIGYVNEEDPNSIYIYPKSFEDKDEIVKFIDDYNANLEDDTKKITYTDYVKTIMGSVTTIVNAVTYVLIAFVSISLIVSSIMIAIITYISVIERTKEIGILRAMGASKRDVKNIFNAETFITGFISGIIGVLITLVLNIPISLIVEKLADIKNVAVLPVSGGFALVLISFLLSVISGLIPASYAAKCDPVIALRSE